MRRIQASDVLERGGERGGDERERGQDRDRVPVHGPGQAVEAVPAEAGAPVLPRLEEGEGEAGGDEEQRRREPRAAPSRSGGAGASASSARSRTPSAASPTDGGRKRDPEHGRADDHERQCRPAGPPSKACASGDGESA